MKYAAGIGADAANMSIGTVPIPPQGHRDGYNRLLQSVANAVTRDGTLLVGSAGNLGANLQQEDTSRCRTARRASSRSVQRP